MTTSAVSAWMGLVLLSLGIAAPPTEFAGGLFLAVAGAFLMMAWSQPEDRKSYWLTLFTAVLFSMLAAQLHHAWAPEWSLHLMMGSAGLFSKPIAEGFIAGGSTLKTEIQKLPTLIREKFFGGSGDA